MEIAVGYVSKASLEELDALVEEYHIQHISLVIGMYYIEGMPEGTYRTALAINEKWRASGVGEIRMTRAFKYHGKLYLFLKDNFPKSAILGSANLGVIKQEANNIRQYEVSSITDQPAECTEVLAKYDEFSQSITLESGRVLFIEDISKIESDAFDELM